MKNETTILISASDQRRQTKPTAFAVDCYAAIQTLGTNSFCNVFLIQQKGKGPPGCPDRPGTVYFRSRTQITACDDSKPIQSKAYPKNQNQIFSLHTI